MIYPGIKHLEVIDAQDHTSNQLPPHVLQAKERRTYYLKNELLSCMFEYVQCRQPSNIRAEQIIGKYFSYNLNPIYQKISKLPLPIFICGFCKQLYPGPSEYLLHCLEDDCPVNHDRSTYFFYFKQKFTQIQNSDISETFTSKELNLFREIPFRKKFLLFAQIKAKPLNKDSQKYVYCDKCKYRAQYYAANFKRLFVNHCVLFCKSTKQPGNSHSLTFQEFKQDLIGFVDDIINLAVNFNIISRFNDSYIRFENNPKFRATNTYVHFCANCQSNFSNETQFIQHCLFQCKDKTNPKSSHLFMRQMLHQPCLKKIQQNVFEEKKTAPRKCKKRNENTISARIPIKTEPESFPNKQWKERFNPSLIEFKDLLQNLYFCGQCKNHFQDDESYLIHLTCGMCSLNHPRNSHFFFELTSEKPISIKTLQDSLTQRRKTQIRQKLKQNFKVQKIIKEGLQLIKKSTGKTIKPGQNDEFLCGKCQECFKKQHNYVVHCLKKCYSSKHERSSHIIKFQQKSAETFEQFKNFLNSYLYAVQIMKFYPNKKFSLKNNEYIDVEPDYLCGKCDTLFGNPYQYVLHSVSVCKNMKWRHSSHFINQIQLKSPSIIEYPLDVVDNHSSHRQVYNFQEKYEKINQKSELMEIEEDGSFRGAKIQEVHQKNPDFKQIEEEKVEKKSISRILDSETQKFPRFLRPNIAFERGKNEKYHCGSCRISFRRELDFISHMKECLAFENIQSSHFYLANQRYKQLNKDRILVSGNYRPFPKQIPGFGQSAHQTFKCVCGEQDLLEKYAYHVRNKHQSAVQKGSSHIFLRLYYHWKRVNSCVENIPIPVNATGISGKHEFVCPCDPWKKYDYAKLVNHIIKRHEGKSPIFCMKFEGQNQKLEYQKQKFEGQR